MARPERRASPDEEALIRAFVLPGRRERFPTLPANPKARRKLVLQFAHLHDLDPRFAHRIAPRDQTVEKIYQVLKEKGAPEMCHVMGEGGLDGRDVGLREALEEIVPSSFGNFISCVPGRLGYFGGEESNERYILER